MTLDEMFRRYLQALRAPADEGGSGGAGDAGAGGGAAGGADGGAGGAGGGAGDAGAAGGAGGEAGDAGKGNAAQAGAGAAEGGKADGKVWWETANLTKDERDWASNRGLLVEDTGEVLVKALRGHRAAEESLGRPADTLLDKPAKDQSRADWMKANKDVFGIPEAPDKYTIDKVEMPKGVEYDTALEGKLRDVAFEHAIPGEAVNALVKAYAGHVGGITEAAQNDLARASQDMQAELMKDWGSQTEAKLALAQRAAQSIAERAGISQEGMLAIGQSLHPKLGDAGIMRLFATVGDMMGEDSFVANASAAAGFSQTPAEAKAALTRMDSPEGEYGKAFDKSDTRALAALKPKRDALIKLASQGG